MSQIILWGILVLILGISLFKVTFAKKGEWHEDFLSLSSSKAVLGIAAVLIVVHHIAQLMGNIGMEQGPFGFLEYIGVSLVGLFFFFSGYGLFSSIKNKEGYFNGFLKKRLTTILVPFYFIIVIFVVFSLLSGIPMTPTEMIAYLSGWWLLNNQMWYVVEIACFYIVFYLIFKNVKNKNVGLLLMGLFIGVFVCASILVGHGAECECDKWLQGEWWFNTSFMLLIGMIFAHNEERLLRFAKKYHAICLLVCIIAAIGFMIPTIHMVDEGFYYCEYADGFALSKIFCIKLMTLAVQFAMVFFFDMTVLLLMMKVKCKNVVLDQLGRVSLVLYLSHNLFLIMFGYMQIGNIKDPGIFAVVVIACAIVAAFLLQIPISAITKAFLHLQFRKTPQK